MNNVSSLSGRQISGNNFIHNSPQIFECCEEDQMLQDLIFRARLCGTGIYHSTLLSRLSLPDQNGQVKMIYTS